MRRWVLARELKDLRQAAGLTHTAVAQQLGWQQGKVSKIEGARQGVGVESVMALAEVCGASGQQRDRLVELAHAARAKGWWESYADVLPAGGTTYVGFEAGAASISGFATETVPELLRTREYAAAVIAARSGSSGLERRLELLLSRQRAPVGDGAADIDVVLAESAVRRAVGGEQVFRRQLRHLVDLGRRPNVRVRVLPFAAGATATDAPFSLLGFAGETHPDVLCVPHESPRLASTQTEEVEEYRRTFEALQSQSLSVEESLSLLERFERGEEVVGS